ncbi:MAG: hypothetical protein U9N78_03835 [Actinomycetota bacterium]|nr:hypothetical protein [Actinomycetota bacterium]
MTRTQPTRALQGRFRTGQLGGVLLVLGALVLAACGGSADETTTTAVTSETVASAEPDATSELELFTDYTFEMPEGTTSADFTFEVPPGGVVEIDAVADPANVQDVSVGFGIAGQPSHRVGLSPGETADSFQYVTSSDGGGTWALDIQANPGDAVTLSVFVPMQADGGGTGDAGANSAAPTSIALGASLFGLLGDEDSEDWYVIPLGGGDVVSIAVSVPAADGTGGVFGDLVYNGTSVASFNVNEGGQQDLQHIFAQDQAGDAYIRVSGSGDYVFQVDSGPQQDGGTEGDAGGDLSSSKEASFGEINGILGGEDTEDFFVLTLPKDAVLTSSLTADAGASGELRVELNYNGGTFARATLSPGQTEDITFAQINAEGDQMFLRVSGSGAYAITLNGETQPDGGDDTGDAQDDASLAKVVDPSGSFDGIVNNTGSTDPRDFYTFTATESASLVVEVGVSPDVGADVRIQVRDDANTKVADFTVGQGGNGTATIDVVEGTAYVMELTTPHQAIYTVTFG